MKILLGEPFGFDDINNKRSIIADYCDLSAMCSGDRKLVFDLVPALELPVQKTDEPTAGVAK